MSRTGAPERVARMLSLVPWVAARGGAPIDEVCRRFEIDRAELLRDLDTVSMVGLYPYTPDVLIELYVDEDRVEVMLPQAFDRPLQLTPEQALALVAAGSTLLNVPGADPAGPLARALEKLSAALGHDADRGVEVHLAAVRGDVLEQLRVAAADHRQVRIGYYAYGRDEHTDRVIDPYRVRSDDGQWYVSAFCHLAGDERLFRVDRVTDLEVLDTSFTPQPDPPSDARFTPGTDDPRVVIDLAADARWVVEQYPVEQVDDRGDRIRVTLAVSAGPWFERLMLRLGPDAVVVEGDDALRAAAATAAGRILRRYGGG
jgi:proteasome accessory factor C